jgi:antitoxin HicB
MVKAKKTKTARSAVGLSTLDNFLNDQGKLEEFQAKAIEEVLAWQITVTIPPATAPRGRFD